MPGVIAWPLIVFMTLVLEGRYRWFNTNLYERYFNSTLAFLLVAQILREHRVQDLLVESSLMTRPGAWQLSTAVMGYSFAEMIGFSLLWSGMPEAVARRKQRYYRLAGVCCMVAFLACGTRARLDHKPLELLEGWDSLTTLTCLTAMLMVLAVRLIWNSVSALRSTGSRRERWVARGILVLGIFGAAIVVQEAVLQFFDQHGWTHTVVYRQQSHSIGLFFAILAPFVIAAVPVAIKILGLVGLDPVSRDWAKLQPLRLALRTVAPECAYDLADGEGSRRKSALELRLTVVEIRDAILRLRPYFRDIPDEALAGFLKGPPAVPARERDGAIAAVRLAYAAAAKAAGVTPQVVEGSGTAPSVVSGAATLEEEVAELVTVAKWWPSASAAAANFQESKVKPVP